jgi:hypothetical protein
MLFKIHKAPGNRILLAVCDKDLIGRKFESKGVQLDLTTSFYLGTSLDKKDAIAVLRNAQIINVVGEKSVRLAVEAGVVDSSCVRKVGRIPHAQSFCL